MGPGKACPPARARSARAGGGPDGIACRIPMPRSNGDMWRTLGDGKTAIKMKDDQHQFLRLLGQLPARLTAEQAAWVLNCQPHDVPALVAAKLLKPLGNPAANSIKFFCTADVLELSKDRNWLVRVSTVIYQHWQKKNALNKESAVRSPLHTLSFSPGEKTRVSDPASASG